MTRVRHHLHYFAALAALPAAGLVAWRLGDARGAGVALGALVALSITLAGWFMEERAMRKRTSGAGAVMTAFALAFLAKLVAVTAGAIVLRLNESLARWADSRAYLLGFGAVVAWVLVVGSFRRFGAARAPKEAPASC